MITGNGFLALRDGRKLDVGYQFSSTHDAPATCYARYPKSIGLRSINVRFSPATTARS